MFSKVRTLTFVLAISMVAAGVASAQFVTDGLVSYFSFDDVSGVTVADAMGNHDGTIVGDLEEVDGKVGNAFLYVQAEDEPSVVIADPDAFSCIDDFTWAAWIKSTDAGGVFMAKTAGSDVPGEKSWQVTGELSLEVAWAGIVLSGSTAVDDDAWHYVAMVYSADDITLTYYVDGGEDASGEADFSGMGDETGFGIRIGNDPRGGYEFAPFDGVVDEVAIYDRALSGGEINANFSAGGALDTITAVKPADKLASTWGDMKISR